MLCMFIDLQIEPFATQKLFVDRGTTLLFSIFPPTTECDLKSPRVLFTALTIANSPKRKKMNAIHFRPVGQKRTLSVHLPFSLNVECELVSRVYDTRAARAWMQDKKTPANFTQKKHTKQYQQPANRKRAV